MYERSGEQLKVARLTCSPLQGLEELRNESNLELAYKAQDAFTNVHRSKVVGYKVGAASEASQRIVGAKEPFFGVLYSSETFKSGAQLRRGDFFEPGMEGEFAFRIGKDLDANRAPFTIDDISNAIDAVLPAIEICDNRFKSWKSVSLAEIIGDNAFHGALVVGEPVQDWRRFNLLTHEIGLSFDGKEVGRGPGELILGHPVKSVLWLANKLAQHGKSLKKGDLVAAGTCTGLHYSADVKKVSASLGAIGEVHFSIENHIGSEANARFQLPW